MKIDHYTIMKLLITVFTNNWQSEQSLSKSETILFSYVCKFPVLCFANEAISFNSPRNKNPGKKLHLILNTVIYSKWLTFMALNFIALLHRKEIQCTKGIKYHIDCALQFGTMFEWKIVEIIQFRMRDRMHCWYEEMLNHYFCSRNGIFFG